MNKTDISTIKSDITTHGTSIATNGVDIATLKTSIAINGTAIVTNKNNITTHGTSIATNGADIATLKNDITTNGTAITTNGTAITVNQTDISSMKTAMAINGAAIATIQTYMTTNGTDTTTLTSRVATIEDDYVKTVLLSNNNILINSSSTDSNGEITETADIIPLVDYSTEKNIALGLDTFAALNAVAVGRYSEAYANGSVAVGAGAKANRPDTVVNESKFSTSVGTGSSAEGDNSIALGQGNTCEFDRSIVIGNGITANQADAVLIPLRENEHNSVCYYDSDTHELTHASTRPYIFAAGSFNHEGVPDNNFSYNCSCISYNTTPRSIKIDPTGFGLQPIFSNPRFYFSDVEEEGHYKIVFNTPLTHVNYSITIQPHALMHILRTFTDGMVKTSEYFTFRVCGSESVIAVNEAFSITVFNYGG